MARDGVDLYTVTMKISRRKILVVCAVVGLLAGGTGAYLRHVHNEAKQRFVEVDAGRLYRSRQPLEAQLRNNTGPANIRRIVNLRPASEDRPPGVFAMQVRVCGELGIEMVNLPITEILPTMEQVATFLQTVRQPDGATLVHCEHGRNRTSVMVAAYRIVDQNWTVDRAMDEMLQYTNLKKRGLDEPREFLRQVFEKRERLSEIKSQ